MYKILIFLFCYKKSLQNDYLNNYQNNYQKGIGTDLSCLPKQSNNCKVTSLACSPKQSSNCKVL